MSRTLKFLKINALQICFTYASHALSTHIHVAKTNTSLQFMKISSGKEIQILEFGPGYRHLIDQNWGGLLIDTSEAK